MRRLWAHILLAFATVAMVAGSFVAVFSNAKGNLEYQEGREVTFKISELDYKALTGEETLAQRAAKEFESRLTTMQVSKYSIKTVGDDIVKVSLAEQTDDDYSNTMSLLSAYGTKAISNKSSLSSAITLSDITTGKAYIENINSVNPVVNIPVDITKTSGEYTLTKFKELTEADEANAETETSGEGEEATETKVYYFYLWFDYLEGRDSYEKTVSTNADYDEAVAARLSPIKFNCADINEETEQLKLYVNVDQDGDESASAEEVAKAFKTAYFYVNFLNTEALDYKIECIANSTTYNVASEVENLVNYGKVNWSKTLAATIACVLIISLLLVVFFRLGTLSVSVISLLATFSAAGLIVAFGAEFTTAGIIGVILVALASLISGIIYLVKLKEDAYRGHTLKKANAEAAKKSLLPILDIHFVLVVTGIMLYVLGGSLFRTFAVATVIGGLVSFVLNALGLKLMMWLATNTTGLIGKYDMFGIDSDKVPNHLAEEKQTYYGPYADKDFTKKKKPVAIVGVALLCASLAGMITFGCLTGGYLFNTGNKKLNAEAAVLASTTEIYIEETKTNEEDNYKLTDTEINDIVNNLLIYEEGKEVSKLAKFSTIVNNRKGDNTLYTVYEWTTKEDNIVGEEKQPTVYHKYSVIELSKFLDVNNYKVITADAGAVPMTIEEAFLDKLDPLTYTVEVKPVSKYVAQNQPSWGMVMLGTFTALAISCVYLCLRYRLSRGLASIVIPVVSCAIAVGVFSLLRIVTTSYAVVALPLIACYTLFISIIFMNKERELVLDDRTKDNSVANREVIMKKANSLAYSPIMISTIVVLFLIILFFGFGPKATAVYYLLALVGVALSALFVTTLLGPISQFLFKQFSKIKIERKPKKNKNKVVKKSAEPEEATFIGIND